MGLYCLFLYKLHYKICNYLIVCFLVLLLIKSCIISSISTLSSISLSNDNKLFI